MAELLPSLLTYGELQKILHNLLRERVSLRNLEIILETLCDYAPRTKDLEVLTEFDTLLVMTVEPGFGGQQFRAEVLPKVELARAHVRSGHLRLFVEVDGGIDLDTIEAAAAAGADVFVAGSSVYNSADPAAAVDALRRQARRVTSGQAS